MLRKILISCIAIPMALGAAAQSTGHPPFSDEFIAFAWDINVPISNNFTNKTSWDGFQFELRKMVKPDLSVGLEINWCGYDEYTPTKTYQIRNGAVTTDFYSYMYTLPLAINAHHYFLISDKITPYAGLALGATYSEDKLYYSAYVSSYYNWGFLVRPELGAIVKFSETSGAGLLVGVRYSYSTNKQTELRINGIQSLGFQIGLVLGK